MAGPHSLPRHCDADVRRVATVALAVVAVAGLLAFVPTYSNSPQKPPPRWLRLRLRRASSTASRRSRSSAPRRVACGPSASTAGRLPPSPLPSTQPANTGLDTVQLGLQGLAQSRQVTCQSPEQPGGRTHHHFLRHCFITASTSFTTANTFNNAPTGKVRATTDPRIRRRTSPLSSAKPPTTQRSRFRLDLDAGRSTATTQSAISVRICFINDPNGPAVPTSNLIDGGNWTARYRLRVPRSPALRSRPRGTMTSPHRHCHSHLTKTRQEGRSTSPR